MITPSLEVGDLEAVKAELRRRGVAFIATYENLILASRGLQEVDLGERKQFIKHRECLQIRQSHFSLSTIEKDNTESS